MIILAYAILLLSIFLFVWGKMRPDMVALLSMLALFITGAVVTSLLVET